MNTSFIRRKIFCTFSGEGGKTIKTSEGLRIFAHVIVPGDPSFAEAQVSIFGLRKDQIEDLSTYGQAIRTTYPWTITIDAGDDIHGIWTIFKGNVNQAWGDFSQMPNVPLQVLSLSGSSPGTASATSLSYSGQVDVAQAFSQIAQQAGLAFENSGVSVKLPSTYLWGPPLQKARDLAQAANVRWIVENGTLAIWPNTGVRSGDPAIISKDTGLQQYPTFTEYGIKFDIEYRKPIKYGSSITVQSELRNASGTWGVRLVEYDLAAEVPSQRAPWTVHVGCILPGWEGPIMRSSP